VVDIGLSRSFDGRSTRRLIAVRDTRLIPSWSLITGASCTIGALFPYPSLYARLLTDASPKASGIGRTVGRQRQIGDGEEF